MGGVAQSDSGRAVPGWVCSPVQNPPEVPPCPRGDGTFIKRGATRHGKTMKKLNRVRGGEQFPLRKGGSASGAGVVLQGWKAEGRSGRCWTYDPLSHGFPNWQDNPQAALPPPPLLRGNFSQRPAQVHIHNHMTRQVPQNAGHAMLLHLSCLRIFPAAYEPGRCNPRSSCCTRRIESRYLFWGARARKVSKFALACTTSPLRLYSIPRLR